MKTFNPIGTGQLGKLAVFLCVALGLVSQLQAQLRVGAAVIDVTPEQLPVLVNGHMTSRSIDQITTRVNARALVLDDGSERIAMVVVDSCMMPRHLIDEAKQLASTRTRLRPDRIMISATHTHTAPSAAGALGTEPDPNYVPFLRQKLADAIVAAEARLEPARAGWGSGQAAQFTALRRWVRRPDRIATDPFGNATVRANMHAARNPDDAIGPTGPEDPELSMIAFQAIDGRPIAVLVNFSMHYFGDKGISADYFGLFCDGFEKYLSAEGEDSQGSPVAMMSHGCSGDIWRRDYMTPQPEADGTIHQYAGGLLSVATEIYDQIEYQPSADLAMLEARLPMRYRVPSAERLHWARQVVAEMGDRLPQTQPEIYAREQIFLHQMQSTEVVVQAMRIGDIAITTTPNETYALTGLKLKLQSPLEKTMVIELANGGDGYIPPPEQHTLGGYNTWAARSAGLEVTAEPRIVAANLRLLEQVCSRPRRRFVQTTGPVSQAILDARPLAYWRLSEMSARPAHDVSGNGISAEYEPGVLFFLDGPPEKLFSRVGEPNRCAHFAGGRLKSRPPNLGQDFTIVLSFWNGMPTDARDVTGWLFSRDHAYTLTGAGIHLGLSGKAATPGRLILQLGDREPLIGKTAIDRWSWAQAALVRSADTVRVYLAGSQTAEITAHLDVDEEFGNVADCFFGGRSDNQSNWEGKLDEIAVFDRAFTAKELRTLQR